MAGYYGYKMSNNAVEAYENGERPLTKWTKKAIFEAIEEMEIEISPEVMTALKKLPVKKLRELVLYCTSWHHTSKWYNRTDFYDINEDFVESLTVEDIKTMAADTEKAEPVQDERWECTFLEWSGTRKRPKATEVTEIGTIRGNWFYRENGTKKSITANGFKKIRRIL